MRPARPCPPPTATTRRTGPGSRSRYGPQLDDVVAGLPAGGVDGQVLAPGATTVRVSAGAKTASGCSRPRCGSDCQTWLPQPPLLGADPVRRHPVRAGGRRDLHPHLGSGRAAADRRERLDPALGGLPDAPVARPLLGGGRTGGTGVGRVRRPGACGQWRTLGGRGRARRRLTDRLSRPATSRPRAGRPSLSLSSPPSPSSLSPEPPPSWWRPARHCGRHFAAGVSRRLRLRSRSAREVRDLRPDRRTRARQGVEPGR